MRSPPTTFHGLEAYRDSVALPFPRVVAALRSALGVQLVAYLGGVADAKAVRQWAVGSRRPSQAVEHRLRLVYQLCRVLDDALIAPATAQAWFQVANPMLKDRSPARMLREYPVDEISAVVLAAARAFVVAAR